VFPWFNGSYLKKIYGEVLILSMELKNSMEEFVERYIDKVMKEVNMCTCQKCRYDVMAIALNNLKPLYTVTRSGALFNKVKSMESQYEAQIISEITKAAKIVMKDTKHDEKEKE